MLHGRLLVYLDEVARTGSMRKAAERLNVAASAVNRQILALEHELGTPLFQRRPRKMVLTAAGEVLVRHIRETLRDLERARSKIEELKGLTRGEITIAIMSGLAGNLLPRALAQFRRAHPHIKLIVRLLTTGEDILGAVSSGEAELALGFDFTLTAGLRILASAVGKLGCVMAPGHPLAGQPLLRISDCVGYPLVMADKSMVIRPHINAVFARAMIEPQPVIETNSIEVMRHVAMLDQGITFLTPFDIEFERRAGRLVYVPIREFDREAQTLMLVSHDRGAGAIASILAEFIKRMMQEESLDFTAR
jgi:DNA-binding transcriptional LysR family regulator